MKNNSEKKMYPDVIMWFSKFLKDKYPKKEIKVYDTSRIDLSEFLRRNNLHKFFAEFETYVIKVDITGVIRSKDVCKLAFVECKVDPISLRDVSQLIGYSRVVKPEISFIISRGGISSPINTLLKIFKRFDILEYAKNYKIKIAKWNETANEIDWATLLPPGEHI